MDTAAPHPARTGENQKNRSYWKRHTLASVELTEIYYSIVQAIIKHSHFCSWFNCMIWFSLCKRMCTTKHKNKLSDLKMP